MSDAPSILRGNNIVIPPYADLALVLDTALKRWAFERYQDSVTPPKSKCPSGCSNPACAELVINEFLQVLAGMILDMGASRSGETQTRLIREVTLLWPKAVAEVRAAMSDRNGTAVQ